MNKDAPKTVSANNGYVSSDSDHDNNKAVSKYVDSGTNVSMSPVAAEFGSLNPLPGAMVVSADNTKIRVNGRGSWHIPTDCGHPFINNNSLYVPSLGKALFSPYRSCASGIYRVVQDSAGW